MEYCLIEHKTGNYFKLIELTVKPCAGECIIYDELPYKINNIVYMEITGEWRNCLLLERVAEFSVSKSGQLNDGTEASAFLKKILGL